MAIKERAKLTEKEIERYTAPIPREEMNKVGGETILEKMENVFKKRTNDIVYDVAVRTGNDPLGYGAWDRRIFQDANENLYAEWLRCDTCD